MNLRRGLAAALAVPAAFVALSISVPAADASIGVGVQAAPVRLANVALTGQSYALPPVYVVDTGTQPESVALRVQRLSQGRGRGVPQSWIRVTGPPVQLSPHQGARIPVELVVPAGAKPGPYLSDIVATASPGVSAGKVNLGVAAATPLEFSVRQGPGPGLFPLVPTWTWWFLGGLLVLLVVVVGVRSSGIRIRIERAAPPGVAPAAGRRSPRTGRRAGLRTGFRAAAAVIAAAGLAACSTADGTSSMPGTAGGSASITITLKTVPTVVAVSVSPSAATFGGCSGGNRSVNTASTSGALGFPNGECWLGKSGSGGSYPITITNTGVAAKIDVNSGNAVPSDGGAQWGLCNLGSSPVVACANGSGKLPGNNQYLLQNFTAGSVNTAGLTGTSACDPEFAAGSCAAVTGDAQTEGIKVTGPELSSDTATSWTVTIKWTAVSLGD
jgi:hypothetical protein